MLDPSSGKMLWSTSLLKERMMVTASLPVIFAFVLKLKGSPFLWGIESPVSRERWPKLLLHNNYYELQRPLGRGQIDR